MPVIGGAWPGWRPRFVAAKLRLLATARLAVLLAVQLRQRLVVSQVLLSQLVSIMPIWINVGTVDQPEEVDLCTVPLVTILSDPSPENCKVELAGRKEAIIGVEAQRVIAELRELHASHPELLKHTVVKTCST